MKNIYLHLNTRDEFLRMDISKIVYFEADGNYTNIVLANKLKSVVCMNLAHMQQILTDSLKENARTFVRVGKRYIKRGSQGVEGALSGIVGKRVNI